MPKDTAKETKKANNEAPKIDKKVPDAGAKKLVTPGAGFDAQSKELAPEAKGGKSGASLPQAEMSEWLQVAANIIKIKPEGGGEVEQHIQAGLDLAKRASADQAKKINAKIAQIRAAIQADGMGNN